MEGGLAGRLVNINRATADPVDPARPAKPQTDIQREGHKAADSLLLYPNLEPPQGRPSTIYVVSFALSNSALSVSFRLFYQDGLCTIRQR